MIMGSRSLGVRARQSGCFREILDGPTLPAASGIFGFADPIVAAGPKSTDTHCHLGRRGMNGNLHLALKLARTPNPRPALDAGSPLGLHSGRHWPARQ